MSGTGNDFLLVDMTEADTRQRWLEEMQSRSRPEVARRLCDRHRGIGADGLVVLDVAPETTGLDFIWDFYNSDGSRAEMCGNAARCAARFAHRIHLAGRHLQFGTLAGKVRATVLDAADVRVSLPLPHGLQEPPLIHRQLSRTMPMSYHVFNTGVPHAVIRSAEVKSPKALLPIASLLRSDPEFGPEGTNVTFYWPSSLTSIEAISYERGVEDFTLSCGSGAMAAAMAYSISQPTRPRTVTVQMPGGRLAVNIDQGELSGSAFFVADFTIDSEIFDN